MPNKLLFLCKTSIFSPYFVWNPQLSKQKKPSKPSPSVLKVHINHSNRTVYPSWNKRSCCYFIAFSSSGGRRSFPPPLSHSKASHL